MPPIRKLNQCLIQHWQRTYDRSGNVQGNDRTRGPDAWHGSYHALGPSIPACRKSQAAEMARSSAREKDINRAPSAPRKQPAQASKLCFIAFANTPCAMRRGTASHLAAGHTAAAVSCRLARRREAVLQPLRTRAVPPKPLAYSAARCSGASRGRQTARGSLACAITVRERGVYITANPDHLFANVHA